MLKRLTSTVSYSPCSSVWKLHWCVQYTYIYSF